MSERELDILSIGEILLDLVSETELGSLLESRTFRMFPGGQAANVALNASRLGGSTALVARTGDDAFGLFLRHHLEVAGVSTDYLVMTPHTPTTLVVVTRNRSTPDFAVYRGADAQMNPKEMPLSLLPSTSIVHTSAFALSREPSRSTVLDFVVQASAAGCLITFDPNYHPRLWGQDAEPLSIFAEIYPYVFLTKPSLDDCVRLFGAGQTPELYAQRFLDLGAKYVVLTMGNAGVLVADERGSSYQSTPVVEVVDVTGAGDSFWAGMLLALIDGYAVADAVRVGQAVAAIKIQHVGPLTQMIDRTVLYSQLGLGD